MKKIIGTIVAIFPFLVALTVLTINDWRVSVFAILWVILLFDIAGWIIWFFVAGNRIVGGK